MQFPRRQFLGSLLGLVLVPFTRRSGHARNQLRARGVEPKPVASIVQCNAVSFPDGRCRNPALYRIEFPGGGFALTCGFHAETYSVDAERVVRLPITH